MKANTIYKMWYRPTDEPTTEIRESMFENGNRLCRWFAGCVCVTMEIRDVFRKQDPERTEKLETKENVSEHFAHLEHL